MAIVKMLGIMVCVLITIVLIAVSALLYYENHDFSNKTDWTKKSSPVTGEIWKYGERCLCHPVRQMHPLPSYATSS